MEDRLVSTFDEIDNMYDASGLDKIKSREVVDYMTQTTARERGLQPFSKKHKELLAKKSFVLEEDGYLRACTVLGELPKKMSSFSGVAKMMTALSAAFIKKVESINGKYFVAVPIVNAPMVGFTNHFFDRYHQRYAKTSYSRKEVIKTFLRDDYFKCVPIVGKEKDQYGITECKLGFKSGIGLGYARDTTVFLVTYVSNDNLSDMNSEARDYAAKYRDLYIKANHEQNLEAINIKASGGISCEKQCALKIIEHLDVEKLISSSQSAVSEELFEAQQSHMLGMLNM